MSGISFMIDRIGAPALWRSVLGTRMALACIAPLAAAESDQDFAPLLPRIPHVEPAEALDTFRVAAGFRLELVAHEPLVSDPVAMAFDEFGRLFVVEMRGYSEDDKKNLGAIRLLIDADQDGFFEKSTEYATGLSWPTAVACYDGGIFVAAAPDVFYLKDISGNGRADVRRVFTGFGKHNVQGLLNSFHWGLDNRIHGATSSCGGNVTRIGDETSAIISLRGRDFSFDPRTLHLRPESGGGQHGMSFDAWGRKFVCSNSDHLQAVVIPDHYLARNPYLAVSRVRESIAADGPQAPVFRTSPIEPWRVLRTRLRVAGKVRGPIEAGGKPAGYFTGATGVTIYKGDAWPKQYRESIFAVIGDVGSNLVHRKLVSPRGLSFVGTRIDKESEFITSSDIWFRPAQFCNGPDGALYILDMYREVIEHPASLPPSIKRHLDLTSGRGRGRIYRILPVGLQPKRRAMPGTATTQQLVGMLAHPNAWHRQTAARLLYQRQDPTVVKHLEQLAQQSTSPLGRLHALCALDGLGRLRASVVLAALDDDQPRVRERAVRLAEAFVDRQQQLFDESLCQRLVEMTQDDDIGVRFQLACSLGAIDADRRLPALEMLLNRDGNDEWMRVATFSSSAETVEDLLAHLQKSPAEASGKQIVLAELAKIAAAKRRDGGKALLPDSQRPRLDIAHQPIRRPPDRSDLIAKYQPALALRGNPDNGARVFKKQCASCHQAGQGRAGLGPNLAAMRSRGKQSFLVNLIDPNREVNPQYVNYIVDTKAGRVINGMLTSETANSVTLADGKGMAETLLKSDIESMATSGLSLMPEGLEKELDQQAVADLFSYLMSAE